MSTQTGLHADDARRELLERRYKRQAPDLLVKNDLAISVKTNEMKHVLADIDTA